VLRERTGGNRGRRTVAMGYGGTFDNMGHSRTQEGYGEARQGEGQGEVKLRINEGEVPKRGVSRVEVRGGKGCKEAEVRDGRRNEGGVRNESGERDGRGEGRDSE
jgi:hypothetical protein